MVDALIFLTSLTIILLVGIVSLYLAKYTKFPFPLFLFISGLILGNITYAGRPIIQLGGTFLSTLSIIALIVVLFEFTSRLNFNDFDKSMNQTFWFFIFGLVLNIIVLSSAARFLFGFQWFSALIFSILVSCVEFYTVFSRRHVPRNKITESLKDESVISCAFVLLVPFVILAFVQKVYPPITFTTVLSFVIDIFAGVGAGLIIALVIFRLMHLKYSEKMSTVLLGFGLLIAWFFARQIEGSGVIAVATMGFAFGNVFLKQKKIVREHLGNINSILEVFLFIIVGVVVGLPLTFDFLLTSLLLFVGYMVLRFIAASLIMRNYNFRDRVEIASFVPKGLATIAAAFALLNFTFFGVVLLVQLLLVFFVYSLVLDTILRITGTYKHR